MTTSYNNSLENPPTNYRRVRQSIPPIIAMPSKVCALYKHHPRFLKTVKSTEQGKQEHPRTSRNKNRKTCTGKHRAALRNCIFHHFPRPTGHRVPLCFLRPRLQCVGDVSINVDPQIAMPTTRSVSACLTEFDEVTDLQLSPPVQPPKLGRSTEWRGHAASHHARARPPTSST